MWNVWEIIRRWCVISCLFDLFYLPNWVFLDGSWFWGGEVVAGVVGLVSKGVVAFGGGGGGREGDQTRCRDEGGEERNGLEDEKNFKKILLWEETIMRRGSQKAGLLKSNS